MLGFGSIAAGSIADSPASGGATTWQGTALLAADSSLSGNATLLAQTTSALAGSGVFSSITLPLYWATATFAGAGVGTFTATVQSGSTVWQGTALLSADSTLTGAATLRLPATATLAGAGVLTAVAYDLSPASAALTGAGVLGAIALLRTSVTAGLAGAGAFSGIGYGVSPATSALAGQGSLTATTLVIAYPVATLSGQGAFSGVAGGVTVWQGSSLLAGAGGLNSVAYALSPAIAVLGGTGVISATAYDLSPAVAGMAGSGGLLANALIWAFPVAVLSGQGALSGIASGVTLWQGSAQFTGLGTFDSATRVLAAAGTALAGSGGIFTNAQPVYRIQSAFNGAGEFFATATVVHGNAVWPLPSQVLYGVVYGPTGSEYTGTYRPGITLDISTGRLVYPINTQLSMLL